MRAQVDVTLNKGVLRIMGNVTGAIFGFVVMFTPRLASSPWALAALLAVWAGGCAALVGTRIKYAAYLALYTASVIILAQVNCIQMHCDVQWLLSC